MLIKCATTLVAILAFAVVSSAASLPPEIADCKVFKLWNFQKDSGGWRPDHNVGRFSISNGILSFELTGDDPWIVNTDPGRADTARFHFLGIKMRSSAAGSNQLYFTTDASPAFGEDKAVRYQIVGDSKFHFYEADLSQLKTWTGQLTALRIDPANGPLEKGAKIEIDWIALYQQPARLVAGRPYAGSDARGIFVSLPITNVGGETSQAGMVVLKANGVQEKPGAIRPRETKSVTLRTIPLSRLSRLSQGSFLRQQRDSIDLRVIVRGRTIMRAALLPPARSNQGPFRRLANQKLCVAFLGARRVKQALLERTDAAIPMALGSFRPLATLAYKDGAGVLQYIEVSADSLSMPAQHTAILKSTRQVAGGTLRFRWTFELPPGAPEGLMTCDLVSTAPINVLRFEGPRLLAGEGTFGSKKTHGLFPGVEYLDENEPSSAMKHTGAKFAERRIPHPFKITVPLMAVEAAGSVVGLSWDPLQEWASGKRLPSAEFESPNRSAGAQSHLMTIFGPSIPDYVEENSDFAKTPYVLRPGKALKISASFFARSGRIQDVIPAHFLTHRLPKPPPLPHGLDGTIDVCLRAYTQTLYSSEANGWKTHIGMGDSHVFRPHYAVLVLAESLRKGDPEIARRCGISPEAQLTQWLGTTMDWFSDDATRPALAAVARQSPDGGFPYQIDPNTQKKVRDIANSAGLEASTLGDVGETNCGLIARELNGILTWALRTGRQEFINAGIRGLRKLNSFSVPRGAQTWEVHAHTPDVYAAALAVDANILGYHLTGDSEYLDKAKFWAYTGLPFVYSWVPPIASVPSGVFHLDGLGDGKNPVISEPSEFYEVPKRQINPGASIPVFGTSFYVQAWFGVPVQWCGLAWANSVKRYIALRHDKVLESFAALVFASATQQQLDKGFLSGTYPDSWNLLSNVVNMAFIAPDLILDFAYSLKQEKRPSNIDAVGFDLREGRAFLTTYAFLSAIETTDKTLDAILKYYPDQELYTCVVRAPKPVRVSVDGRELAEVADLRSAQSGFCYDGAHQALHIKYRVQSRTARVNIDWP